MTIRLEQELMKMDYQELLFYCQSLETHNVDIHTVNAAYKILYTWHRRNKGRK